MNSMFLDLYVAKYPSAFGFSVID